MVWSVCLCRPQKPTRPGTQSQPAALVLIIPHRIGPHFPVGALRAYASATGLFAPDLVVSNKSEAPFSCFLHPCVGIDWLHLWDIHRSLQSRLSPHTGSTSMSRESDCLGNMMLLFLSCKTYKLSKMLFSLPPSPPMLWVGKPNESCALLFLQKKRSDSKVQFY